MMMTLGRSLLMRLQKLTTVWPESPKTKHTNSTDKNSTSTKIPCSNSVTCRFVTMKRCVCGVLTSRPTPCWLTDRRHRYSMMPESGLLSTLSTKPSSCIL
eukprot:Rmarinus@m.15913